MSSKGFVAAGSCTAVLLVGVIALVLHGGCGVDEARVAAVVLSACSEGADERPVPCDARGGRDMSVNTGAPGRGVCVPRAEKP